MLRRNDDIVYLPKTNLSVEHLESSKDPIQKFSTFLARRSLRYAAYAHSITNAGLQKPT
jgi:hypothetical protein